MPKLPWVLLNGMFWVEVVCARCTLSNEHSKPEDRANAKPPWAPLTEGVMVKCRPPRRVLSTELPKLLTWDTSKANGVAGSQMPLKVGTGQWNHSGLCEGDLPLSQCLMWCLQSWKECKTTCDRRCLVSECRLIYGRYRGLMLSGTLALQPIFPTAYISQGLSPEPKQSPEAASCPISVTEEL